MDICLVKSEKNVQLCPKTILGMLWLQTHFEPAHWEALASSQVQIPMNSIDALMEDANSAGIKLDLIQNLCINKKF